MKSTIQHFNQYAEKQGQSEMKITPIYITKKGNNEPQKENLNY